MLSPDNQEVVAIYFFSEKVEGTRGFLEFTSWNWFWTGNRGRHTGLMLDYDGSLEVWELGRSGSSAPGGGVSGSVASGTNSVTPYRRGTYWCDWFVGIGFGEHHASNSGTNWCAFVGTISRADLPRIQQATQSWLAENPHYSAYDKNCRNYTVSLIEAMRDHFPSFVDSGNIDISGNPVRAIENACRNNYSVKRGAHLYPESTKPVPPIQGNADLSSSVDKGALTRQSEGSGKQVENLKKLSWSTYAVSRNTLQTIVEHPAVRDFVNSAASSFTRTFILEAAKELTILISKHVGLPRYLKDQEERFRLPEQAFEKTIALISSALYVGCQFTALGQARGSAKLVAGGSLVAAQFFSVICARMAISPALSRGVSSALLTVSDLSLRPSQHAHNYLSTYLAGAFFGNTGAMVCVQQAKKILLSLSPGEARRANHTARATL